jgi:3-oxoacyl-[acyl-carrier-protein] synthase II
MSSDLSKRRVVIAGMGVISPSGKDLVTLQTDDADVVTAGAEEMLELLHVGFCRLRAMTERGGDPKQATRPFDLNRDGFVLGKGAAFFVLEELFHAPAQGARIYAEVAGHGRSCEADHATNPHSEGLGYVWPMKKSTPPRAHPSPGGRLHQCPRPGNAAE